jgi:hypothetical protein
VPVRFDRNLDLGANSIRRRDEHRVAKSGSLEVEQSAEAADLGIGAGARGRPDQGLIRSTMRLPASMSTPALA